MYSMVLYSLHTLNALLYCICMLSCKGKANHSNSIRLLQHRKDTLGAKPNWSELKHKIHGKNWPTIFTLFLTLWWRDMILMEILAVQLVLTLFPVFYIFVFFFYAVHVLSDWLICLLIFLCFFPFACVFLHCRAVNSLGAFSTFI